MSAGQKLVSVIVPVYNRESYLEECVESVFAQSWQNIEIVLIDDGSTDNSVLLARKLQQQDARVRVLESAHLGVSGARNVGLDAAQGEYVFFLDSDDVIHPWLIETLVSAMETSGAGISGTDIISAQEDKWHLVRERIKNPKDNGETVKQSNDQAVHAIFTEKSPLACIGGVMMRRDLIGQTRFRKDLFIGEDFYFIYENLIKGTEVEFLKQHWYYVRNHENNISKNYGYDGFWTRFLRRKLVWEQEAAFGRKEYVKRQKLDAIGCYTRCISKHKPYSAEARKIRRTVKEYRAELLPAMEWKQKMVFLLKLYCPICAWLVPNGRKRAKKQNTNSVSLPLRKGTDKTGAYKNLLLDFLRTPLDDGEQILRRFAALPGAVMGEGENPLQRYVFVPGTRKDGVVLVAHADTVWDKHYDKAFSGEQDVKFEDGVFSSANPDCGLGADDRAGCAMLWALRDCGHSLLVVDGEEHGKRGAHYLRKCNPKLFRKLNRHSYMIELDWAGTRSCLFNQVDNTEKFKAAMQTELNLALGGSKGGTDLQVLCRNVCGVNVGVGWHGCHTAGETLVLAEWENTLEALSAFLAKPQRRYRTKAWPRRKRWVKRILGMPLRGAKKLISYKSKR